MDSIGQVTLEALRLVFTGDPAVWEIIGISFKTTAIALGISLLPALGLAFALAHLNFPGRRLLVALFNSLLSVPAVVIGLTFYLLLSRQGPFGELRLLFTQPAMVIGQIALCFPILVAMQHSAFQAVELRAWETARTLGQGRLASSLANSLHPMSVRKYFPSNSTASAPTRLFRDASLKESPRPVTARTRPPEVARPSPKA